MLEKAVNRLKAFDSTDGVDALCEEFFSTLRTYASPKTIDLYFYKETDDSFLCWYRESQGNKSKESYYFALNSVNKDNYYNAEHILAYPLKAWGVTFGSLVCYFDKERLIKTESLFLLLDYFALMLYTMKISFAAVKDKLTGLYNRGYIYKVLEEWEEEGNEYAIILMDIDKFKHYNDTYGHPVGDHVLKTLAKTLKANSKDLLIGRYGGEEFLVGIKKSNEDSLKEIMERYRILIKNTDFSTGDYSLRVTASFGGSVRGTDNDGIADVIRQADEALYESKRNGRNMSSVYRLKEREEA